MQSIVDFALRGARDSMEKVLETARQVGTLADLGRWGFVMDVVVKLRGTDVKCSLWKSIRLALSVAAVAVCSIGFEMLSSFTG